MQELLRCPDERVGLLREQAFVGMNPTPSDCHGEHSRRLRGADVERRVPDVDGLVRLAAEPLDRQ